MVITGLTRNQLSRKAPWVRIPPAPPKSPVTMRVCWTFFLRKPPHLSRKLHLRVELLDRFRLHLNYISYAGNVGGEMLDVDTIISYWEIGVIDANEAIKQEILYLLAPTCFVTFKDCTYSYAQRIAAFDGITALNDPNMV